MQSNIKPANGRILIKFKPADQERITDGGIYVPNTRRETLLPALVVAVADDVTQCRAGDVVLVHHNEGFDILASDHKTLLRFVPQTGIYGILQPSPEAEMALPAQ